MTTNRLFPAGCPCAFPGDGAGFQIAGLFDIYQGTWAAAVDYTNPAGVTTPNVVQREIYLVRTPLVAVLHGFKSACSGPTETLRGNLAIALAIQSSRVRCYDYAYEAGVRPSAESLGPWLRDFVNDVDPSHSEVDLVAHSMGGLVARYYQQFEVNGALDPAVGSIAMLGTPNEGVDIAKYERWLCPRVARVVSGLVNAFCTVVDIGSAFAGVDLHSAAIDDFKPDSDVLEDLNSGFTLPSSPIYSAHVGQKNTWFGRTVSGSGPNDCFISHDRTFGRNDIFRSGAPAPYPNVSHSGGLPSCDGSNTLTNNSGLLPNLQIDISRLFGFPPLPGGGGPAALLGSANLAPEPAAITLVDSGVMSASSNSHIVVVPSGVANTTFAVYWLGGESPADLAVTLTRPGGATVSAANPDVLEVISMSGSGDSLYMAGEGFTMQAPAAGNWVVQVTGVSTGTDGAPYIVGLFPDSQVALSASTSADVVLAGGSMVAQAQLLDQGSPVAATMSARVVRVDGTEQTLTLVDDGTNGDAEAGDLLYSRTVSTAGACGTVRLLLSADAPASSEGLVHREQLASFDVNVPGDATRDPCDPDDDGDGLTDDAELNVHGTNPVSTDTDGDGFLDPAEITMGTDPQDPDTDNDGFLDLPQTLHLSPNTGAAKDNCPLVANMGQQNTDGNFLTQPPPSNQHDRTIALSDALGDACDPDDDNDGLTDAQEVSGCNGSSALDPLNSDTDGDFFLDGIECTLGSSPSSNASRPGGSATAKPGSTAACGPVGDSDGDRMQDRLEVCAYNTVVGIVDSDGDLAFAGSGDGCEIASLNGDRVVNSTDQLQFAQAYQNNAWQYHRGLDVNKDGALGSSDQLVIAQVIGQGGPFCI